MHDGVCDSVALITYINSSVSAPILHHLHLLFCLQHGNSH